MSSIRLNGVQIDHLLDSYNRYQQLYHSFGESHFRLEAERIIEFLKNHTHTKEV